MTVDAERVHSLLERLRTTESELRRLRSLGPSAVRDDPDRMNSVKYLFVVAAEVAIDTGQHVIAAEALEAPSSFAEVFRVLGDTGWLPMQLAEALGDMARFRNLLVHGYADVDDDRVVQILGERLDDLMRFRQRIAARV